MTQTPSPQFSVSALRNPIREHHGAVWGPPQYTNWIEESLSWKETCYLGDWTFLPSMRYTGPDVLRLFSDVSVNTMNNFAIGQSKHIIQCDENGKIIDDAVLSRTGEQEVISFSTFWADYVRRQGDYDVEAEYVGLSKFHLQGPTSLFVLESAAQASVRDLKFMRSMKVSIADVEVTVLRQGMSGEVGFELQFPIEKADVVRAALLEAGSDHGMKQMGGRVAMLNHLEAYYPTQGLDYMPAVFDGRHPDFLHELVENGGGWMDIYYRVAGSFESDDIRDWYRSPVEFGWGNRINFDHEFIGADALREEVASPRRSGATLVWNSEDIIDLYASLFRKGEPLPDFMELPQDPRGYVYADSVLKNGERVGITSSRGYSAYFREMISLCVLDVEHNVPGDEVTVLWGNPGTAQREIRATIAPAPYKPNRSRVDLHSL
uniref:Berberine demethylenase n=1 Tax=Arthrobacter sp. GBD-1 TaxID=1940304 RepID=A0A1Q2TD33_9MICC|nr:berberine demethylenase [Arthrobacter sp. GBD-1]